MNWYKTAKVDNIRFVYYDDAEVYGADAHKIAHESGINILSDKELFVVALSNKQVVGAGWRSWRNREFSFDVAVIKWAQGSGLGSQLTNICIQEFEETREAYGEDSSMNIHAVNPVMEEMLKRRNFQWDPTMRRQPYYQRA